MMFSKNVRSLTVTAQLAAHRAATVRERKPRRGERGFALLIVFMMAAAIAILMYQQLPRVAFESQRDKEELLIERGEQYKRAIKLYYVQFNKYPSKIEDLESSNNMRFLRHRFIDPMTGKDEWRLIHANNTGNLLDSQNVKPPAPPGTGPTGNSSGTGPSSTSTFGSSPTAPGGPNAPGTNTTFGSNTGFGSNPGTNAPPVDPNAPPAPVNPAVLRRPSDRTGAPQSGAGIFNDPNAPGGSNYDPNDPRYWPAISLTPATPAGQAPGQPGQPGVNQQGFAQQYPGQQFPGQQYPGQPNPAQLNPGAQVNSGGLYNPGQPFTGQLPNPQVNQNPQQVVPATPPILPGQPGFDPSSGGYGPDGTWIPNPPANPTANPLGGVLQPGQPGVGQYGQPGAGQYGQPGAGQYGQPGVGQPGQGNAALSTINNMLRTPQQAPPTTSTFSNNTSDTMNALLVGVATKFEGPSIKIYKDHQKYNLWEFIFDLKENAPKVPGNLLPPGQNGQPGQAQPNPGQPGQTIPGVPGQTSPSTFTTGQANPTSSN